MTLVIAAIIVLAVTGDEPPAAQPSVLIKASSATYTPPACDRPKLNRAITFYRGKYRQHRHSMRAEGPVPRVWYRACDTLERRSVEWRDRANQARLELVEWTNDQWAWQRWLPHKWQRIGACETGYGRRPGNWRHNSGSYQGAFGFAVQSWDSFVPHADPTWGPYPSEAYEATPRQQYEVALAIYRRYGLSGWGCRNA